MFCPCFAAADSTRSCCSSLAEFELMYGLTSRSNVTNSASSSWIDGVSVWRHSGLPLREKVSADDRWTLAKDVVIFGMKPRHQISVELRWVFVLSFSPRLSFLYLFCLSYCLSLCFPISISVLPLHFHFLISLLSSRHGPKKRCTYF